MPTYEYKCHDCGEITTKINRISRRKESTPFCECGGATDFKISIPLGFIDAKPFPSYKCTHSSEMITSHKSRRQNMAKHNLVEAEPL